MTAKKPPKIGLTAKYDPTPRTLREARKPAEKDRILRARKVAPKPRKPRQMGFWIPFGVLTAWGIIWTAVGLYLGGGK